jgi:hypothetical protein
VWNQRWKWSGAGGLYCDRVDEAHLLLDRKRGARKSPRNVTNVMEQGSTLSEETGVEINATTNLGCVFPLRKLCVCSGVVVLYSRLLCLSVCLRCQTAG